MKATTAVFAACFLYFALFRSYGFQVEDEGTLLFWLDRVLRGELPYVDFHTGYTPGFFYLCAALLRLAGDNANNLRLFVDATNAATAAGLYLISRRFVGTWMAAVAPVLWVAFLPVYPGEFASFNVPYPAWFAGLAWVGVALSLLRFVETGRRSQIVVTAFCAAAAFAVKPNAGAFALAASTWVIVGASRGTARIDRVVGLLATIVMALGVWTAFGFATRNVDALVHLLPLAALTVLFSTLLAGRYAEAQHPRTLPALCILAAGFVAPTLLWVVPVLRTLGLYGFANDVLLIGSNAAQLYYEAPAPPQQYALFVVAAVIAIALGGLLVRKRLLSPVLLLSLGPVAAVAIGALIATNAVMPESATLSISWQLENAAYWIAPLVHCAGLWLLVVSARRGRPLGNERRLAVLVPVAVAMYWQVFPRTDFTHVEFSVPVTLVLGTWLLDLVTRWWREGSWPQWLNARQTLAGLTTVIVAALVFLETGPILRSGALCLWQFRPVIDTSRLRVCVEPDVADDLTAFGDTARYLSAHTEPGENVLTFPALSGLLFADGLASPVPHDYWFPGRPSHEDERRMLATLRDQPPRFITTLNDGWTVFVRAPEYFREAREFVSNRYRLVARRGRFDVLARTDLFQRLPRDIEAPRAARRDDLIEPSMTARRQAARRWMSSVVPEQGAAVQLPADTREAVLLLRALRDADLRGIGWLMAGYSSTNPRVHREAVASMQQVALSFGARQYRWANDYDPAEYVRYVAPYADATAALADSGEEGPERIAMIIDDVLKSPATPSGTASSRLPSSNDGSHAQALR